MASATLGNWLNLSSSPKFLEPISVTMYHPLKGAEGKWIPPISRTISEITGNTFHFKFKSLKLSYSGCWMTTSLTKWAGNSKKCGFLSSNWKTTGKTSNAVPFPFQPKERQTSVKSNWAGSPIICPFFWYAAYLMSWLFQNLIGAIPSGDSGGKTVINGFIFPFPVANSRWFKTAILTSSKVLIALPSATFRDFQTFRIFQTFII